MQNFERGRDAERASYLGGATVDDSVCSAECIAYDNLYYDEDDKID